MRLKSVLQFVGGLALAVLLLGWVLRQADLRAIADQLRNASLITLLAALVLNFAHNVFRVWRWGVLLEPIRPGVPFRPMFSAVILGYMTSWTVPGRLGELVRPALLSSRERIPLGPCLGSVLADRLLDGVAVLVLFLVGILVTPLRGEAAEHAASIRLGSLVLVGMIAVPLVVLVAASMNRARVESWVRDRRGLLAWLGRAMLSVASGLEAFRRPRLLARLAGHTMAAWLLIALATWLGVRACGAGVSFGATLVIMPLLVLGIALPTPGGAGGYHAAMAFGLSRLFSVDESIAVGASFVMHALIVLPVIIVGVALLLLDRLPFADLLRVGRAAAAIGASADDPGGGDRRPAEKTS